MPELGHEYGTAIRDDGVGNAMKAENVGEEEPCETGGVDSFVAGNEMSGSDEAVANDPDRIIAVRCREFDDEIHGYGLPGACWDVERLEESVGLVTRRLDARTCVAGLNVAPYESVHAGPRVVASDKFEGADSAWMTSGEGVMTGEKNVGAKGFRNKESAFVENEAGFRLEVFRALNEGFTPFRVLLEGGLEAFEEGG